jgi:Trk K+ transport system NAD-binding subunit
MANDEQHSFGVFKPVGHVVISLPDAQAADRAAAALGQLGLAADAVRRYTDREMLKQIDADIAKASPIAAIGQEMNLILAHRVLAERGYHWLVVYATGDEQAVQIARAAEAQGADRAQHYGHFIIEELIERPGNVAQVAESPDRGLDAQTPSGKESEAADAKQAIG